MIRRNISIKKLHFRGDVKYELQLTYQELVEKGYQILSVITVNYGFLIVYRIFFEDTPLLEEDSVKLRIRIITKKGTLYPEPYLNAFYTGVERNNIELADIYMESEIRKLGYGTILMNHLIKIAINTDVAYIKGFMVSDSENHRLIQIHFYKKNGFEINGSGLMWENNQKNKLQYKSAHYHKGDSDDDYRLFNE
ncbi:GNAT family N-acetyltransferase [Bacillus cereus]|nr:GNAT family N-acetyltransferase [Bacillus cereus]